MGGSSGQVVGYRYFTNFLLFIGNPIENLIAINFDKRGWIDPFTDEDENILDPGVINSPSLYGETEGGVAGAVYLKTGTNDQGVVPFYKDYMESKELQASAYPYQSYLAFKDFYVGNSGYMKEMLLWPKRTRIRNDGRRQWYEVREDGAIVCEIGENYGESNIIQPLEVFDAVATIESININNESEIHTSQLKLIDTLDPDQNHAGRWFNWIDWNNGLSSGISNNDGRGRKYFFKGKWEFKTPGRAIIDFHINLGHEEDITFTCNGTILDASSKREATYTSYFYKILIESEGDLTLSISISKTVPAVEGTRGLLVVGYDSLKFEIFPFEKAETNSPLDINPIHKIREILTDDTAMNKPESDVNDINFRKAADRIFAEGLGVSWSITEKSCIDAINELCYHIEAGIRVNRQTGLYEMVLFRDNWFEENEIHTIAESKIKSMQYEITNADEVINQVNVNFYDRENIKNSSFSISESGLIQTLGRVNAETVDFPYFMNMRNAEIVANWKLKILSTGVLKGSFTTGWREARKWNRYDLIRLPWSKRWVGTILVRIMSINLGGPTNNEVSIEFVEVVPSTGMMNTTIVADDLMDKPLPPQGCQYETFELPYYLAVMALGQRKADEELAYESNFGLVGVVAEKPQENSLYAVMMTNNYDEWIRAGSIQYSETADSDQFISRTATSFTVKNWKKIANFPVGTLIQCGREWLTGFSEWMVFQGIDTQTGVMSVKRGALDTQPQDWDLDLKLYFCGTDVAYDATEYVAGEKVLVSALTTTPSGVLELKGSNAVDMKARAIRPYPPANVKINGEYWPEEIETDLVLTWVDRNRPQQTGGKILGWFEGGVTLESGVTYQLILTELDESQIELRTQNISLGTLNTYTFQTSAMNANTYSIEIVLKTLRDGYECLTPFNHTIELSQFFSAPFDIQYVVSDL